MMTHGSPDTKARLLEAAGEVFAEQGFRRTTIRQICKQAGANIAAVNYYFGDKQKLYLEAVMHAHQSGVRKHAIDQKFPDGTPPEECIRRLVRSFVMAVLDAERPSWHGQLMMREMMDPTGALEVLTEQSIRPKFEVLVKSIQTLLGPGATVAHARLCANSVIGQCLYYQHARHLLAMLVPGEEFSPERTQAIADHIAEFSLAALRMLRVSMVPTDRQPPAAAT